MKRLLCVLGLALGFSASGLACGESTTPGEAPANLGNGDGGLAATDPSSAVDAGGSGAQTCIRTLGTESVELGIANVAGEHALQIEVASASKTSWAEKGNEALVLEVFRGNGTRIGHVVLHQGQDRFLYGMHAGALAAGESVSVRISDLSAPSAEKRACVSKVTLAPIADLGELAEGIAHAPVLLWPKQKAFDDLPILLGWSRAKKSYQATYTNENGGTVKQCGGGAEGIQAEIARWGRAFDIEGAFSYGGAGSFGRCTGGAALGPDAPRMEGEHPRLYYGDGHNRLFESRGGYGGACGKGGPEKSDGDLEGWNVGSPGLDPANDDPFTIVLRPLPVDMDAVGFVENSGRREGIVDTYAPWLYRLTDSEIQREGKVDGSRSFPMQRYLFVDVYANDVGGRGDSFCSTLGVDGGFVIRAIAKDGTVSKGPQMTKDFFGGETANVKRIAIPLAAGVQAKDIAKLVFDAYDDDGVYWLALGDAFVPQPSGTNGATLEYVNKGKKLVGVYVDDGSDGCVGGSNTRDGVAYPCKGTLFELSL